jgi:hypothetical protein
MVVQCGALRKCWSNCPLAPQTRRYADVVQAYQGDEYMSTVGNCALNIGQSVILSAGSLAGMVLCAYRVGRGQLTAGDFVLFVCISRLEAAARDMHLYMASHIVNGRVMFGFGQASTAVDATVSATLEC